MNAIIVLICLMVVIGSLYYFLIGPVEKTEPRIVTLKEPIKMIGVSMRTGMKTIYNDAGTLGREYRKIKDRGLIKNKKEPWGFVVISKDFQGTESWEYLMGDVVSSFDSIPAGLKSFEIPVMTCAVFTIRPKSRLAWGAAMGLTKKYIYTEWLPKSKYEADGSIVGDFEYHDARSLGRRPEINLYIAIKEKGT